jgi:hypothetical protein
VYSYYIDPLMMSYRQKGDWMMLNNTRARARGAMRRKPIQPPRYAATMAIAGAINCYASHGHRPA